MIKYETIKKMKLDYQEKHPNSLVLVQMGNFYHAYGKDSYIISYIFGYKIINNIYKSEGNEKISMPSTGFPCNAFDRVSLGLEEKKINFIVSAKGKEDIFKDFKNLNTYTKRYNASKRYCEDTIKLDTIKTELDDLCGKKDFSKTLDEIDKIAKTFAINNK